jgi:hypothetical protein
MTNFSATVSFAVTMTFVAVLGGPVFAQQQPAGCTLEQIDGTARQVLRCGQGVTVMAEEGASFEIVDRNGDAVPDAAELRAKALLIDIDNSQYTGGFEVVTPQAVAAVRGTQWAVDVSADTTSVLVVRGSVAVSPVAGQSPVTLGPGQGVDVTEGGGELVVRNWPAARVAALLSRLGQ